jgi:hypothetical protein
MGSFLAERDNGFIHACGGNAAEPRRNDAVTRRHGGKACHNRAILTDVHGLFMNCPCLTI